MTRFLNPNKKDYQLNLVENYLLKLRYSKNMKSKNDIDFGFLKYGSIRNAKINKENKVINKTPKNLSIIERRGSIMELSPVLIRSDHSANNSLLS